MNEFRFFVVKLSQRFDKNITHKMLNYLARLDVLVNDDDDEMDGAREASIKEIAKIQLVFSISIYAHA